MDGSDTIEYVPGKLFTHTSCRTERERDECRLIGSDFRVKPALRKKFVREWREVAFVTVNRVRRNVYLGSGRNEATRCETQWRF